MGRLSLGNPVPLPVGEGQTVTVLSGGKVPGNHALGRNGRGWGRAALGNIVIRGSKQNSPKNMGGGVVTVAQGEKRMLLKMAEGSA